MDRNSIIGYVLIGLVLVGYFYFIQPNPQQIEVQKHYQDSIAAAQYEKEQAMARELQQREKELLEQGKDSASLLFNALNGKEEFIELGNDKIQEPL